MDASDKMEQVSEIQRSIQELKTVNKFALKRLNQLLNKDNGPCPLCGCECAADGYSKKMHDLEVKVEDFERKQSKTESDMYRFFEVFKEFKKSIQSSVSDLPELVQVSLGTLFNMLDSHLIEMNVIEDEEHECTGNDMIDSDPESVINVVRNINSSDEESEKDVDSSEVRGSREVITDTAVPVSNVSHENYTEVSVTYDPTLACTGKQEQSNTSVNTANEEYTCTSKTVKVETEHTKFEEPFKAKEKRTQTVKPMVQRGNSSNVTSLTDLDEIVPVMLELQEQSVKTRLEPAASQEVAESASAPRLEPIETQRSPESSFAAGSKPAAVQDTIKSPSASVLPTVATGDIWKRSANSEAELTVTEDTTKCPAATGSETTEEDMTKSPSASKLPDDVLQTEKKYVEESVWHVLGAEELHKAKSLGLQDITGAHTVICFDISASMKESDAWRQAKTFFNAFISGLEDIKIEHDGVAEENVALCTFGHKTGVAQRMTKEFCEIREAFKNIRLGGPSPLYGGLMMAVAALAVPEDKLCTVVEVPIMPRLILVTDGHCTSTNLIAGPDEQGDATQKAQAKSKIMELVLKFQPNHIRFTCVSVGQPDQEFLELMAATANGKVISYKDGREVAEDTLQRLKTGGSGLDLSLSALSDLFSDELKSGISLSGDSPLVGLKAFRDLLPDKGKLMETLLKRGKQDYYHEKDNKNLPTIGSRVRRGPDWQWQEQDSYGPGTVIGHDVNIMSVWVEWDGDGHTNVYRYGQDGAFDLLLVDEPRILSKFETIAVGCVVKKGPGWKPKPGEEEPAERGVVIKCALDSTVTVRWDDKKRGTYKWEGSRKSEIEVCDPRDKAFRGGGHILGGGPEFEARQKLQDKGPGHVPQERQNKNTRNKNKNKS